MRGYSFFSSSAVTYTQVSPPLVQLFVTGENLCEREIATHPRCATIGTVQEISCGISSALHEEFLIKRSRDESLGALKQ
jgi:hypothetical protein